MEFPVDSGILMENINVDILTKTEISVKRSSSLLKNVKFTTVYSGY